MTGSAQSRSAWRSRAARLGERLRPADFHPEVAAWLARSRRGPWGVAFSGGADSLALLLTLWAHWPERRDRLVALHFNHRLRGRESDADERFCRRVCAALGLRCRVGRWAGRHRGASEAAARAARHGFLARAMRAAGVRTLWLAHQQDDIAESLLMRLARGSGTAGLAAPRPVQAMADGRTFLRPLLPVKKATLVAALRGAGLRWREDRSNAGMDHFRNRLRHRVLPGWIRASGRDALAGAALARERLDEDDRALEAWVDTLRPLDRRRRTLDLAVLGGRPRAVVRRALHRWLLSLAPPPDLSRQGFETLLTLVERGRPSRFSLGHRWFAVIRRGRLTQQRT
ncbi:MAG: tRNA lysidine(34) synthetase TilS [Opitutaceae bacterium]|nr:tRNA lysidine(34) synthetase TilS [Opitutaceae bacterium]